MALEPPVEEEYPSLEHAESVVSAIRLRGYALTRVKDKRKPPTVRRRDLRCSKGGVKRGEGVLREDTHRPRRDHSTRRNPSAFELTAGTQARRPGRVGSESFSVKPFLLGFIQQLADHFTGT